MSVAPNKASGTPRPAPEAAFEFLLHVLPDGPWVLHSCPVEGGAPEVTTIYPGRHADGGAAEVRGWLFRENMQRGRNTYVALNPAAAVHDKKARKDDVTEARMLWVDCDPDGPDLATEREKLLNLLRARRDLVPPPSVIIDSGRGFWALWLLDAPAPIATQAAKDDYEARLRRLIPVYMADRACHNLDRICRLPGSVNWPKEAKRVQGATPRLATVVEATWARHAYDAFPRPTNAPATAGSTAEVVSIIEPRRLTSVDELDQWAVNDRVKVAVVQGHDPENPKLGDNSRSAWVFDVACQLVRAEVPDAVILGVLTDPDFAISDSILEKGGKAHAYALRQIARAKEFARDPALAELNEKHAIIYDFGGRVRIMTEGEPPLFSSLQDFRARYLNRVFEYRRGDDVKRQPLADWWLRHADRRFYQRVEFLPGDDGSTSHIFNLWRGWPVAARDGRCDLFLAFVREVIADGRRDVAEFLLDWLAHMFQRPAENPEVAVAMRGGQGTGKSFFAKHLGELVGRHFVPVADPRHLYGNFNAPLLQALLVFADEAFAPEDKKSHGILKALVTEEHITIEPKGVDAFKARKFFRLILASNNSWVVPADVDDRRFLMLDVSDARQRDYDYFSALENEWRDGGREAFLAHLLRRDLSGFNHRARPKTAALEDQKLASLRGPRRKVYDWLVSGDVPAAKTDRDGRVFVVTMELAERERCTAKALGLELARASHCKAAVRETVDGRQCRGFWLSPLAEARQLWARAAGLEPVWPMDDGIWGACATTGAPF